MRFLNDVKLPSDKVRRGLASSFAKVHVSVSTASMRVEKVNKRFNYTTPTHYLELVTGYVEEDAATPPLPLYSSYY